MSIAQDIVATYRGPGTVVARRLSMGEAEGRGLAVLMAGCALVFFAQMPRLAREAHLDGSDLNMMLGGSLMAWIFIAPLFFYGLGWITHGVARLMGGQGSGFSSRFALFWALLAAGPLMLLWGLTAGFVGPGIQRDLVGLAWIAAFLWFWIAGLLAAHGGQASA